MSFSSIGSLNISLSNPDEWKNVTFQPKRRNIPVHIYGKDSWKRIEKKSLNQRIQDAEVKKKQNSARVNGWVAEDDPGTMDEKSKSKTYSEIERKRKSRKINKETVETELKSSRSGSRSVAEVDVLELKKQAKMDIHDKLFKEGIRKIERLNELRRRKKLDECTFQPEVNAYSRVVKSRFMGFYDREQVQQNMVTEDDRECTFKPRINTNYVSIKNQQNVALKKAETKSRQKKKFRNTDKPIWERDQLRKQKLEVKRKILLEQEQAVMMPPKFCKKSLKIAEKRHGSFDQRLIEYDIKKKFAKTTEPEECTFKPAINKRSKKMAHRSVEDMKRDAERVAQRRNQLRAKLEEKEMNECTFNPQLKPSKVKASSFLAELMKDPQQYAEYMKKKAEEKRRKAEMLKRKTEREELIHCTHIPKISELPEYIKTISESISIVKRAAALPKTQEKPKWI